MNTRRDVDDDTPPAPAAPEPANETTIAPRGTFPRQASDEAPAAGKRFDDYELLEEIARGGMGVVYKARQTSLNRIVALKLILAGEMASSEDVGRFLVEAQSAAALDHPGIIPVYEVGRCDDRHFYSMRYVEGASLAERVVAGPLDPRRAAESIAQAAAAVHFAHENGVLHRDIKPSNILVDHDAQARVADFGLAGRLDEVRDSSSSADVFGTPNYMAPEQAAGDSGRMGPPTDVYGLGATLYCLLTGRPPFQSANRLDVLLQVVEQEPLPARQLNPQVPRDLETICAKCLRKDPRARYETAEQLAADLRRFLADEPILARPIPFWTRGWKWARRRPTVAGLTAVSFVLAIALGAVFVRYNLQLREETRAARAAETRALRLQQRTNALLKQIGRARKTADAVRALRYTDYGRLAAAANRIAEVDEPAGVRIAVDEFRQIRDDSDLAALSGVEHEALTRFETLAVNGRSETETTELDRTARDVAGALRSSWLRSTEGFPEIRRQIRAIVYERTWGAAAAVDSAYSPEARETARDEFVALYFGELAVVEGDALHAERERFADVLRPWDASEPAPPEFADLKAALNRAWQSTADVTSAGE